MLQRRVRQELMEYSSTCSLMGSYLDRRTTQAPQPPVIGQKCANEALDARAPISLEGS